MLPLEPRTRFAGAIVPIAALVTRESPSQSPSSIEPLGTPLRPNHKAAVAELEFS
jgi:hypothetical protein